MLLTQEGQSDIRVEECVAGFAAIKSGKVNVSRHHKLVVTVMMCYDICVEDFLGLCHSRVDVLLD